MTLMLDSGAVSKKNTGKRIDPEAYTRYCLDNAAHVEKAVALDTIPKRFTRARLARTAAVSCARWERMRAAGVDAMPVLHHGEPWEYLDRYASACGWLGLASGRADSRYRYDWLDEAFARLAKYPEMKVHGFGETRLRVVLRHSWFSVDSRTATHCALKGQVFVPMRNHKTGRLILGLYFIGDTDKARHARQYAAQSPEDQQAIRARVEAHGFTIAQFEDAEHGATNRARYNAAEFDRLVAQRAVNPAVRIFHSTAPSQDPFRGRTEPRDRLLSYAFLDDGKFDLASYAGSLA